ncbi:MAG: DUF1566 domain-containing protein [Myxococcota bacterium]
MVKHISWTGQESCHDAHGDPIDCSRSGQDAEMRIGNPWPRPRFVAHGDVVSDRLTELTWLRDANIAGFPYTWSEALDLIAEMNHNGHADHDDWRLPSCRELRSLISYQTRRPALPEGHPFEQVYPSWYWSGTTAAVHPSYAWYVNMDGGRMFYGHKDQSYLAWPVRGGTGASSHSIATPTRVGETDMLIGVASPEPRFAVRRDGVEDRLTGLVWQREADPLGAPCTWQQALDYASELRERQALAGRRGWHLPTINELASLVDYGCARPALPPGHPFGDVPEAVWASTTSLYEPDWAWALYLHKGACGVGQKALPHYHAWLVYSPA